MIRLLQIKKADSNEICYVNMENITYIEDLPKFGIRRIHFTNGKIIRTEESFEEIGFKLGVTKTATED